MKSPFHAILHFDFRERTVAHAMSEALPFMQVPAKLDGYAAAGNHGFDPFGFTDVFNVDWLREAEIKHGRVAMLAVCGFAHTDLGWTLPGEMHKVSSIAAHDVALSYGSMQQIFYWVGIFEVVSAIAINQMITEESGRKPGDFGLDPFNLCGTPEKEAKMKLAETVHCRLAMFAFSGMVTQAVLTGNGFPYLA
jgi:hypothetical protein